MIEIRGWLEAYCAGEGRPAIWSIHETARPGEEGVHPLLNGDFLTVYDRNGGETWSGIVDLDFDMGQAPDPGDPAKVTQMVLGRPVCGLQKYLDPEAWARMFLNEQRAVLRRFRAPSERNDAG